MVLVIVHVLAVVVVVVVVDVLVVLVLVLVLVRYSVQVANLLANSLQKAVLFTATFAFLLMEFPIEIYGTLAALVTFLAFAFGFLDQPLGSLVAISKHVMEPYPALNGPYVLPAAVMLALLLPCFGLVCVTRKVSRRQERYHLRKRKTNMSAPLEEQL